MSFTIHAGSESVDVTYVTNGFSVYNLTVDVIRMTEVSNRDGTSETPVTVVNLMPCAIKWLSGKEKLLFNKQSHVLDGALSCRVPVGVTIAQSDKILYDSEYYEIVDVRDVNNLGVLLSISIRKVK